MSPAPVRRDNLRSCYFYYGEESFLAVQFIEDLKEVLFETDSPESGIERFSLEDSSWPEIIDVARTVPFFSARRLLRVDVPDLKYAKPTTLEEALLADYFQNEHPQTVMVVVFPGKQKKSTPLIKFFSSLPSPRVHVEELKSLKEEPLKNWIFKEFRAKGKDPTPDAVGRMAEMVGSDLGRIHNEIEKIVIYVGDKKQVDQDDINQISGWVKSFLEWEITENLEKGDYFRSILVLDKLFNKESVKPEYILGYFSRFFSNLLKAKLLLAEKSSDRKAIFQEVKPQILEKFRDLYTRKYREFFSLVDRVSMSDLDRFLGRLEKIDMLIKTSSLSAQTLLEGFLFEYCGFLGEDRLILKERH